MTAENYSFTSHTLVLIDEELSLFFNLPFTPLLLPNSPKEGERLGDQHLVRVLPGEHWIEKSKIADGQYRLFYPNGRIKAEMYYANDLLHGPSTFFQDAEDKLLLCQSWFIHGKQQGKCRRFTISGSLYSLERYVDGVPHGRQEVYFEDGTTKTQMNYTFGKLASATLFSPNGSVEREIVIK